MNEATKTLTLLGTAVLVVLAVWLTGPRAIVGDADAVVGRPLFPDFTDPLEAADLEIIEFDEQTATVRPFRVAQETVKGRTLWSIPSHDNYPADAKDQLAEVATGLVGLEVLSVATDEPGAHSEFGVLDPGSRDLRVGATGVGTRVTMKDAKGKTLLSLVIGKKVSNDGDLHYVRRVGADPVYVVSVKTDKLSTRFADWIEKDLLKLSPWDIQRIWIRDHSVDEMRGALVQRGETVLEHDDRADPRWKIIKDVKFDGREWVPREMADDEELDNTKLDDLKYALDDLKIVDVRPKPPGLSADLKATGDFAKDQATVEELADRGFYVASLGGRIELFSNEGEFRCLMKDGVEYVLRFGGVSLGGEPSSAEKAAAEEEGKSSGLNRYLFVTAEFNPEAIEKPVLTPLPDEKPTGEAAAPPAGEAKSDADAPTEAEPANTDADTPAKQGESADDAEAQAERQRERERIEKENQRKQEEYEEQLKKGQDRVQELNNRFGDWYYIISNDVYQKIHLSRDQIVKKKTAEDDHDHADHDHEADAADSPLREFDRMRQSGPGGPHD